MVNILLIILYCVSGFIAFVLTYLLVQFFLSRITISKEANTTEDVAIYILTNGVHTDIVVPVQSAIYDWSKKVLFTNTVSKKTDYPYLAMGWGDKGFYLETPEWKDLKFSVAFNAAFGLSTTAIHATFHQTMEIGEHCRKIMMSKNQYQRLIEYITGSFQKDKDGNFLPIVTTAVYGKDDAFYEANGNYNMLHTCNTWANTGLKKSGQKCCLWTAFNKGIFLKYK